MQYKANDLDRPNSKAALKPSGFRVQHCWRLLSAYLLTASVTLAQVPFTEVVDTGDLGADFRYNWGASWGDFDDDGDVDVLTANGNQEGNSLFRNNGDLTFTRMTAAEIGDLGNDAGDTSSAVWGDIDNDGDLDVYMANYSTATNYAGTQDPGIPSQPDRLYLNNGDGTFALQAETLFGPPHEYSAGASLADFDGDGFLDILVTTFTPDGSSVNPKAADILYRHDGSLGFSRVGGFTVGTLGLAGGWFDYDEDGDFDVLIQSEESGGRCWIYKNQKQETGAASFVPMSQLTNGVALGPATSGAWGDYDNDGDLDFVLNFWSTGVHLYTNEGEGNYSRTDLLSASIDGARYGASFDYDNDGDLDLIIAANEFNGSWAAADELLLENHGGGTFSQHVFRTRPPNGVLHRPIALADINNDGFIDVFMGTVTRQGVTGSISQEKDRIWTNDGNTNHWLKLVLKGTDSNRSAVGAIVRVLANIGGTNVWQMRQVMAGGSTFAQHDPRPNFGLGDATFAEVVRIRWPSGTVQQLTNVAVDQILHVTEPPRIRVDAADTISWPASAAAFELQSADQVGGPWTNATESTTVEGHRIKATLEPNGPATFYRLRIPTLINP